MPERPARATLFKGLREALSRPAIMTQDEAAAYSITLQKGSLTSRTLVEELSFKPARASDLLSALARKGFVEPEVREEGEKARKGQGITYRPVHPKIALKESIAAFEDLKFAIDLVDEHLTSLADKEDVDERIWRVPPKLTAEKLCAAINAARSSIKIMANDCTWAQLEGVLDALGDARGRGVVVTLIAHDIPAEVARRVQAKGIDLHYVSYKHVPFALLDERTVYLHHSVGAHPSCLYTSNPHAVQNYLAQFNGKLGECQHHDGKVARAPPLRPGDERQPEGKTQTSEADVSS